MLTHCHYIVLIQVPPQCCVCSQRTHLELSHLVFYVSSSSFIPEQFFGVFSTFVCAYSNSAEWDKIYFNINHFSGDPTYIMIFNTRNRKEHVLATIWNEYYSKIHLNPWT